MVQYGYKITQHMKMAKIVQNNLGKIIRYLNTFKYFGKIYSFAKIFFDFFMGKFIRIFIRDIFIIAEYIRIFIRPISMVTNILGYSFVQKIYICPTLSHTHTIYFFIFFYDFKKCTLN